MIVCRLDFIALGAEDVYCMVRHICCRVFGCSSHDQEVYQTHALYFLSQLFSRC